MLDTLTDSWLSIQRPWRAAGMNTPFRSGIALVLLSCVGLFGGCRTTAPARVDSNAMPPTPSLEVSATFPTAIDRVAFGSCAREADPQPIWWSVIDAKPDVFLMMGDNIYGDTNDMRVMRRKYDSLAAKPGFAALRKSTPILATWDDHDYGKNDGGADFEFRDESQVEFLRFFGVPKKSARWKQHGVYNAATYGPEGRRMQIIILDTRYFRSELERWPEGESPYIGPYRPAVDSSKTVLGEEQWAWLRDRLREPADLRIIVSSIQVIPGEHGFETWSNFPVERRRLFKLIERTGANGVVLVSGDRHLAEMSVLPAGDPDGAGYPIYEVTSSALVRPSTAKSLEPNRYRVQADNYRGINFGTIDVDWDDPQRPVSLRVHDSAGSVVLEQTVPLATLTSSRPQR